MSSLFNITTALANDIVGQKRTGKSKQFVFIQDLYVIKGPYQQNRLNNVITRSQLFQAWKTPCVVKAIDHFQNSDGIFVRYPNIMAGYNLESELYNEEFSGLQYKILKNPPVIDVGHAIPMNPWITDEAENVILALCHCNILSVGDMNLRNTLVNPSIHEFYVIDFDDNLGTDRDDEVFYFNKPPGKNLNWYSRVSQHYNNVATRLLPLLNDPLILSNNLLDRVNRAINLLRRFSSNPSSPSVITNFVPIPVAPKPSIADNFVPIPVAPNFSSLATNFVPIPVTPSIASNFVPIPVTPNINSITDNLNILQLNVINLGQMVWKGLRGGVSKTYSGIDFDIAKSALQKYIRRNMPQKGILTALELYRLGEVGGDAGVSNMYNRLAMIANEDIGPANLPLILEVTSIVESKDRDPARLAAMVQLLAGSNKTRIMSHAWRAYATPEGRLTAAKMGLPLDTEFTESDIKYISDNRNSDLFLASDPENIRPYILIFLKRLHEKDFNAFTWAYFYLETAKDLTLAKRKKYVESNTRSSTGKSDILLWKALSKILQSRVHDVLVEGYYNHTESRPFLQNAIIIALYRVPYEKFDIEPAVNIWRNTPALQEMLHGKYPFEVDAFVIDKHTRKGRQMGMTTQDFVDEGALVIPQDTKYFNQLLADIYKIR